MRNNQTQVHTRQTCQEEEETIRRVAEERTPQQRATNWLSGVAEEDNDVKDIVMQELWGKEDFSKCLNPMAWVRALHCNTVYITCYRSMHVPVSIHTSYFMADNTTAVVLVPEIT
jgi:hypothetical protein